MAAHYVQIMEENLTWLDSTTIADKREMEEEIVKVEAGVKVAAITNEMREQV